MTDIKQDSPDANDQPPQAWCKQCDQLVTPIQGRCPQHKTFLSGNTIRLKHPVSIARKDAILEKLVSEFPPRNTIERSRLEHLASALERLDAAAKPGTVEWQRLIQGVNEMSAELQGRGAPTVDPEAVDHDKIEARLELLLRVLREDKQKSAYISEAPPNDPPQSTTEEKPSTEEVSTPIVDRCHYCNKSQSGCNELKTTQPDTWQLLHASDPVEIERRDEEHTREMLAQVGRKY